MNIDACLRVDSYFAPLILMLEFVLILLIPKTRFNRVTTITQHSRNYYFTLGGGYKKA